MQQNLIYSVCGIIIYMNKKKVISQTVVFVKRRLEKEGTGHDWWHIERVRTIAKKICLHEQADYFIVDLAILLHDIGDRKVIGTDENDYTIAENFLKTLSLDPEIINTVMFIIRNMSFSQSFSRKQVNVSREFQIVQDADRLDALGAIGIARVFAFGGSKARPLYDPTKKPQRLSKTYFKRTEKSTSFHHFYEKILLLKDLMNTQTAKKIAKKRHEYIKGYMKEFLLEWEGKV